MKLKIICKLLIFSHIVSIVFANVYRNKFKDVCGQPKRTGRIIGGTNAESGEFPWMTRIGIKHGYRRPIFFCGGSLISDMHVLSAEHCFYEVISSKETKLLVVSLGDTYQTENYYINSDHPALYNVSKVITYNLKDNFSDDIAILLLTRKVKFNDWISPVCLLDNMSAKEYIGETAIVIGFGLINSKSEIIANILQKVTIMVRPDKDCELFKQNIGQGQLCAGIINKDSCNGDSGGPLFKLMKGDDGLRYVQLGVVSYGSDQCEDAHPGVYTNIYYYINWIDNYLNSHIKRPKNG